MNQVEVKRLPITPKLRDEILQRDNYTCRYCGNKVPPFHLDHVYPVSKGGETSKNNLVTSCMKCNSKKHDSVGVFPKPIGYFDNSVETLQINWVGINFLLIGTALIGSSFLSDLQGLPKILGDVCLVVGLCLDLLGIYSILKRA